MPERRVVNQDQESGSVKKREPVSGSNASLCDDAGRYNCFLLPPDLMGSKYNSQYAKQDEQGDNAGALPGVCRASPLQGEEEGYDGRDEEGNAEPVADLSLR